ncbi:MAG: hypothetical protein ACREJ3_10050 [Polyangiaceae bacterium]
MKTHVMLATFAALLAGPITLPACGGSNSPAVSRDSGAGSGSNAGSGSQSGSGSSGSANGGSGSSGDGSGSSSGGGGDASTNPGGDAGTGTIDAGPPPPPPIPVPDGGAPSDPGSVECGGAPCSVSTMYCCVNQGDGGTGTCETPNTGCAGTKIACNEASDCNGGVCCETPGGVGILGPTQCSATPTCPAGTFQFQVCRTDGECGASSDAGALKRCIPQTCTDPQTGAMHSVEACAQPPTPYNMGPALYGCKAN